MPNKDWYWDRFDVDVVQGELDLSDAQTLALQDNEQFTDQQATDYETRWIDELYGTAERAWETNQGESLEGREPTQGSYSVDSWQVNDSLMHNTGFEVTWGLDLVRDWTGKEDLEVGSDEHYEWQTRGTVDWAHYYDDNAYQKAWNEYKSDRDNKHLKQWSTLEDFLTEDRGVDTEKVDFLDWAKDFEARESDLGEEALRSDWDNKYVDQFDPETAQPYVATYLDVPDLWSQAEAKSDWESPLTPITVVKPPNIPTLDTIERTQVEVPDSIKHFGEAKSAPTGKYTAGGN